MYPEAAPAWERMEQSTWAGEEMLRELCLFLQIFIRFKTAGRMGVNGEIDKKE